MSRLSPQQREINNSSKLSKVPIIIKYMCEHIDNLQTVKRLCRYLTLDPLEEASLDYNNKLVMQPDLHDSLLKKSFKDKNISPGATEQVLFPYMFSGDVLESTHPYIFVFCDDVYFTRNASGNLSNMGYMKFKVEIVYDINTERLDNWNTRAWSIAQEVMNLFDGITVTEEEYVDKIGNVEFEFKDHPLRNVKLAPNTTLAVMTIPFLVNIPAGRL